MTVPHDIADRSLASVGRDRIEWSWSEMPVLRRLHERLERERPLAGLNVAGCLHITTETANLARTLKAAGARVALCASNLLSTQDDVAAALVTQFDIPVYAIRGEDQHTYHRHLLAALAHAPVITLDDGADLVSTLHLERQDLLSDVLGGTEETTTGVIRLRAMAADGALKMPLIAVNEALTKHMFDNRYGTGQSALDGVLRATNILLAGKVFAVVGYGWCGRGIAARARGLGARVLVCEVDPLKALEATMDGYQVTTIASAAAQTDFMLTVTGDKHVVDAHHLQVMKDGCVIGNVGHFNVEINTDALAAMAERVHRPRPSVDEYRLPDGRRIRLLTEGRLVNLAAAEGHPAAVMDMSFANQALAVAYLAEHGRSLPHQVHDQPAELDRQVAELKLAAMGIEIDQLTPAQERYLASWQEGT